MMKKLILFFSLVLLFGCTQAQTPTAIPHYKILQADSTYKTWANLKKGKPVILIYFSPDCPHCQKFTLQMKNKIAAFKDMQIVMISFNKTEYPWMGMLRNFKRDYEIGKYKNITLGTEYPNYVVQRYYQIQTTPFIAVFNKAGKLEKAFDKQPEIEDVLPVVKKVQR